MPNCSAPGCKGNYTPEDRVPVFKLPEGPPELRHAWIRALHREDIADLKTRERPGSRFQSRSRPRPIPAVSTVPVLVNLKVFPGIPKREWTTRQKLFIE